VILFRQEHVKPILEGRKTETRRLWAKPRVKVGSIQMAKTAMYDPRYFAKLKILGVELQYLGKISDNSVRREGYDTFFDFKKAWEKINNVKWDPAQEVHVIRFEVVEAVHDF